MALTLSMDSEKVDFVSKQRQQLGGGSSGINCSAANRRQKHYKILKEEDIKHLQQNDISTVSAVLSVPRGLACSLLCKNNWSLTSVYDQWFAAADGDRNPKPAVKPQGSIEHLCNICHIKTLPEKLVSAACGHLFCRDCWKTYIATAVSGGAACLKLCCPDPGCGAAVTFDMVEELASEAEIDKYHEYLRGSYVESNRNRKWCPAAGCDRAVEFDGVGGDVVCDCSHKLCWRCGEEWHRPVDCEAAAEWLGNNFSEAKNTKWILSHTKPCPKCERLIEKVDGCNHMTCGSPCEFEFCWMCRAPWEGHGGDSLICKYYEDGKKGNNSNEEERSRMEAKVLIERYLFYYRRWESNDELTKGAMNDLERVRRSYDGDVEMQFVVEAWEQVVECRRVLKWSYVYGYYLPSKEGGKTAVFEFLKGQAEGGLEWLHRRLEGFRDDEDFREFRAKVSYSTKLTRKYFKNLVVALENDLVEVESFAPKLGETDLSLHAERRSSMNENVKLKQA